MTRSSLRFVLIWLVFAHLAVAASQMSPRPNVVVVFIDDLRADAIGALGNPAVKTPHLDQLVERGFVFRRAYTMGSMIPAVCTPSRAMLLTGKSLFRADPLARERAPDERNLPRVMKAAGYATLHVGKRVNSPSAITDLFDETYDPGPAAKVMDATVDFIRRRAGEAPLFLYIAGHEPHDPQSAPAEFYDRIAPSEVRLPATFAPWHPFDNGALTVRDERTLPWPRTPERVRGKLARYYASLEYFDREFGRVLDALSVAGELERTVFVIAGDNGLSLGEHGLLGKQNLYEFGGMHVPLVLAGAGIPKGETRSLAYLMDVFPTLCELTSIAPPAELEGESLWPVVQGEAPRVREHLFTAYGDAAQRAVTDERWKLTRYPQIDKTQLFDLENDPREQHDLAGDPRYAVEEARLTAELVAQQRKWGDAAPLTVAEPRPAEWSPEKLTAQDLKDQAFETARCLEDFDDYFKAYY